MKKARWRMLALRHDVQRTRRKVLPPPAITAPIVHRLDHTVEAVRNAYFEQSARTINGRVAPFESPPEWMLRQSSNAKS